MITGYLETHHVVGNVRAQLLEVDVIAYVVRMLRDEGDPAKITSLRAIIALAKYGA